MNINVDRRELFKPIIEDKLIELKKRQSKDVRDIMKSLDEWEYKKKIKINNRVTTGFKKR